ncbi:MAG: sugar ABC transporter permease [Clostridia bacterium]|nr:sugar ABC transporter permease [Clostridia bacterium]
MGNFSTGKRLGANNTARYRQKARWCYIMMTPQIIGFLVFTIIPIVWAISRSWFFYNGIETYTRFIGWENFRLLTKDKQYWQSLLTTIEFAFMKLPIEYPLALTIAVLLNKKIRGIGFFRTVYYMPYIISVSIRALIFANLFTFFGFINTFFTETIPLMSEPIDWFGTKFNALCVLVLCDVWGTFGLNVLYFLGALQNVPSDIYEAAEIDGAGKLRQFFSMTLPMIAPTLQIMLMLSIVGTLGSGEIMLVLTNGAPGGQTFSVNAYIFSHYAPGMDQTGINIGYGCALSLVTALIMTAITIGYTKFSKRLNNVF